MGKIVLLPEFGNKDPGEDYKNYYTWLKEKYNLSVEIEQENKVKYHAEVYWHPGWDLFMIKYSGSWHINLLHERLISELNRLITKELPAEIELFKQHYARNLQIQTDRRFTRTIITS